MIQVNTKSVLYPNIDRLYPNATITGIKQICFNSKGWEDANYTNCLYSSLGSNISHLFEHATAIQIEVTDEHGQKRYPDYKLNELI